MLKLYDDELSGDSYKVRLMLGLLDVPYERVRVEEYPSRQTRTPQFLAMNPRGTLPVLQTEHGPLDGAHAILAWLATPAWLPSGDAWQRANLQKWLDFGAELSRVVFAARAYVLHGAPAEIDACRAQAKTLLRMLDETCWFNADAGTPFVCATAQPTIADIACFVPVALIDEAEIEAIDYPALRTWCARIKQLEGFTTMAGVYAAV